MNPTPLLDSTLIRRRRLALALSERELATRTGSTAQLLHSLETDRNHTELTIAFLVRLAAALGLHVHELLLTTPNPDNDPTPGPKDGQDDAPGGASPADVAAAGALLATARTRTPIQVLAESTGWTFDHTEVVLDALAHHLTTVGMVLERNPETVTIVPAATAATADDIAALSRRTLARTGMNLRQARLLHQVHTGNLTAKDLGGPTRVALGELINAGLITWDTGPRGTLPTPHPDVDLLDE
jgi:transcriptional regulator with XRE-family HTH domain